MKKQPLTSEIILSQNPQLANAKILVATSGGVDSMVLCDVLNKSNLNFSVAHCNFQLRGNDSDADQNFVKDYCLNHEIECFTQKFNVKEFKTSGNFSTQMAARKLRYAWFKDLMQAHKFDCLVTAHHLNDSLETFVINLSRGTGIKGLTGISSGQKHILRPLLSFSKEEILEYAKNNHLKWREDSSNASIDYVRNKIRHQIVPVLKEIHPNFLENFSQTIQHLESDKALIFNYIELIKRQLFRESQKGISISIEELNQLNPQETYLFYLFRSYGFQHPYEIQKLLVSENGEISSKTFRLIKNREELLLVPKTKNDFENEIELNQDEILEKPLYLKLLKSEERDFSAHESLDYEKIKFPLRLRKKKTGDIFFPIGMKGSKKLSKFFKDEKFSKPEKENIWLLVDDDDKILYVIGKRIDDRFKITEHTHKYLNIYL